jgi:hypothetical protein
MPVSTGSLVVNAMSACKNCGHRVYGAYCSHCGQSAGTGRITFASLSQQVLAYFTHLERGFLYTTWSMLAAPGRAVSAFIAGIRKPYQKPVSYFFIWTAAYVILVLVTERSFGQDTVVYRRNYFGDVSATEFATHYLSLTLGVIVPIYALLLQLVGMRRHYNYMESLCAILYLNGTLLTIQILFLLLAILVHLATGAGINNGYSDILKVIYVTWFAHQLLDRYTLRHRWLRASAFSLAMIVVFVFWRTSGLRMVLGWLR